MGPSISPDSGFLAPIVEPSVSPARTWMSDAVRLIDSDVAVAVPDDLSRWWKGAGMK